MHNIFYGLAINGTPKVGGYLLKSLKKLVATLVHEKSTLRIETDEQKKMVNSKEASVILSLQDTEEIKVNEIVFEQYYSILALTFKRGNKWKLADSIEIYSVLIEDEAFLNKIDDQSLAFRSNDIMKCRIRKTQYQSGMSFRTEMVV